SRPALRILDEPVAQSHKAKNERHWHADQQNAEQAAHRTVLEIFEYELAGHFFLTRPLAGGAGGVGGVAGACPTTCKVVPSGWSSTNFSGPTPLLMSIFTISTTTAYSSRGRLISMCLGKGTLS